MITFCFNTICQTQALNRGTLSPLQVHCFLISLWEYFTAFAYLLFPYCSHRERVRETKSGREVQRQQWGRHGCVQSAPEERRRQSCAAVFSGNFNISLLLRTSNDILEEKFKGATTAAEIPSQAGTEDKYQVKLSIQWVLTGCHLCNTIIITAVY